MFKAALFDIDGVIYNGTTIFDVIKDEEERKILPPGFFDQVESRAGEYKAGKISYKEAADWMLVHYTGLLKGKAYDFIYQDALEVLERNKSKFFSFFPKLLPKLKSEYDVYLVTANFQFVAEAVGKIIGVTKFIASEIIIEGGIITGKVKRSLAGNKDIVADTFGADILKNALAAGDSENDIKMLEKVGLPVCFEPDEKLTVRAQKDNWLIVNRENACEKISELI